MKRKPTVVVNEELSRYTMQWFFGRLIHACARPFKAIHQIDSLHRILCLLTSHACDKRGKRHEQAQIY